MMAVSNSNRGNHRITMTAFLNRNSHKKPLAEPRSSRIVHPMASSLDATSLTAEKRGQRAYRSGNAPAYERWLARLRVALEERGSSAEAIRAYKEEHGAELSERALAVTLANIKSGKREAGGNWMAFLNEWMAGRGIR